MTWGELPFWCPDLDPGVHVPTGNKMAGYGGNDTITSISEIPLGDWVFTNYLPHNSVSICCSMVCLQVGGSMHSVLMCSSSKTTRHSCCGKGRKDSTVTQESPTAASRMDRQAGRGVPRSRCNG